MLQHDDCGTGGTAPPAGQAAAWLGYVGVADVDAAVAAVSAASGRVMLAAQDIPGVGRFAFLADPQGVPFYVMRGDSDAASTSFDPGTPGRCHWNELAVPDPKAALGFWGAAFGWRQAGAMSMGPAGDYTFVELGGRTIGAVMPTLDGRPPSFLFYFGVDDLAVAAAAVGTGGGVVHHGPAPVPGGMQIVVATDPQGAWFGLVGPDPAAPR